MSASSSTTSSFSDNVKTKRPSSPGRLGQFSKKDKKDRKAKPSSRRRSNTAASGPLPTPQLQSCMFSSTPAIQLTEDPSFDAIADNLSLSDVRKCIQKEDETYLTRRQFILQEFEAKLIENELQFRRKKAPLLRRSSSLQESLLPGPSVSSTFSSKSSAYVRVPVQSPFVLVNKNDISILGQLSTNPPLKSCSVGGFRCTMQTQALDFTQEDEYNKI